MEFKILILDIETSLMEVKHKTFSLYGNDVIPHSGISKDWYIHCIGYKWLGKRGAKILSTHQNKKLFKRDHTNDKEVVTKFYDVLKEADLVIGHNLDRFDLKKLNTRFIKHGLDPIIMPPSVDTLKAARKYFNFSSNRLDYIAQFLVNDAKMETEHGLWHKAFEGDYKATTKMAKYCKQDINITEKVYLVLRPHIHNHPNIAKIRGYNVRKKAICPACGSTHNKRDGKQRLKTGLFQYHECLNCDYRYKGERLTIGKP